MRLPWQGTERSTVLGVSPSSRGFLLQAGVGDGKLVGAGTSGGYWLFRKKSPVWASESPALALTVG